MNNTADAEVVFRIRRFDSEKDPKPHYEDYRLKVLPGMTVLDGLWKIKETVSPSLSWRVSCRMGICGSCGMMINGLPRLACNTQIAELGTKVVTVAPLVNFDTIRDLVPDLSSMFETHARLKPFLIRKDEHESEHPTAEYKQTSEEMESYLQFSYCIKCGCCMAACPTSASDRQYSGPMPLAQAHRYNVDTRDEGFDARRNELSAEAGPWRCHFGSECSRVCPKGVDPAKAIQWMKRSLVLDYLHLRKRPQAAGLAPVPKDAKRREGIPEAPKPTV